VTAIDPPSSLRILGQRWTLEIVDGAKAPFGGSDTVGETQSHRRAIVVDGAQADIGVQDTVLHETVHAILIQLGLTAELTKELDERLATLLGVALLDVIRSNPELVDWLRR
jgi:hypothetical protein